MDQYQFAQMMLYMKTGRLEMSLAELFRMFRSNYDLQQVKKAEKALGQSLLDIRVHIGTPPNVLGFNTVETNETYLNAVYAAFLKDINVIIKTAVHEKIHEGLQKYATQGERLLDEGLVDSLAIKFMEEFFHAGLRKYTEESGYSKLVKKFKKLWEGKTFTDLIEGVLQTDDVSEEEEDNYHVRIVNNVLWLLAGEPYAQFEEVQDFSKSSIESRIKNQWPTVAELMNRHLSEGKDMDVEGDQGNRMQKHHREGFYTRVVEMIYDSKTLQEQLFNELHPDDLFKEGDYFPTYEDFVNQLKDSSYSYIIDQVDKERLESLYGAYLFSVKESK